MITLLRLEIAVAAAKLYAPQIFKDEHNPSIKPIKKKVGISLCTYYSTVILYRSSLNLPNQIKYLMHLILLKSFVCKLIRYRVYSYVCLHNFSWLNPNKHSYITSFDCKLLYSSKKIFKLRFYNIFN